MKNLFILFIHLVFKVLQVLNNTLGSCFFLISFLVFFLIWEFSTFEVIAVLRTL